MIHVEIINARMNEVSNPRNLIRLFNQIRAHVAIRAGQRVQLVFFRNCLVENDWSIHLHWETQVKLSGRTELGIKLAEIVRPLALVDHSIWTEEWINDLEDPTQGFKSEVF
ncbi:hypothetical protein [Desulfotignum balticum]|uniref:hypothetical protein n=1 Tax=Desulfotignum balticum TaxID=115781 RepID=UPI000409D7AB|nr:hypothetical protein [Desulfotignum balticum]